MLGRYGAGAGSWMVHYPLAENDPPDGRGHGPDCPGHLRAPWVSVHASGSTPSLMTCMWHEARDAQGRVLCRGPGRLPDPTRPEERSERAEQRCWNVPRHLRVLEAHRDPREAIIGFNGRGETSSTGPFWLVSAPTLQDLIEEGDFGGREVKVSEDEIKNVAASLTTYLRRDRERSGSGKYDFAELITATPALGAARGGGLRVPPLHERFTEEDGWNLYDKEHRRRFREFQARCQPCFLSIGSRAGPSSLQEDLVRARLEADFITQAAMTQIENRSLFQVKAPCDALLWEHEGWVKLVAEHPDLRIFRSLEEDGEPVGVATNSSWLEDFRNVSPGTRLPAEPPGDLIYHVHNGTEEGAPLDTEEAARRLLLRQDFSMKACLDLLRGTQTAPTDRSRKASLVQSGVLKYDVYGQYTHGGMSGVTKRTESNKQFVRYINEFLTRRGARGPRSSFAITSGARLAYHRDSHNVGQNYVNLGDFSGGQVWVEEENGPDIRQVAPRKRVRGRLHAPQRQVLSFSPRRLHGPEPWHGERWSIVAYQTRSARKLNRAQRRHLRELGFDVRGYQSESLSHQSVANAVFLEATGLQPDPLPVYAQVTTGDEEEEGEVEENSDRDARRQRQGALRLLHQPTASEVEVSEAQMSLVRKLHNNCGHPPVDRFLRTLKAAGALPHVLRYVRDRFHCQECESRRGPLPRRKAQCPRLFSFNRVVSIDVFYVRFKDTSVPVLNMVCSGTNYQVVQRLEGNSDGTPSSWATWQGFLTTWIRFLGCPQMIICDGGPEFRGQFERGLEQLGVLQHVTIPECPWQNSKSERHGGWLKERLQREVNSGQCSFDSLSEMDEFLASITAAKNRWYNQGGYTPVQLVFGELPRVPAELLSEDQGGLVPLCDAYHDPAGLDECGAEFRKRIDSDP